MFSLEPLHRGDSNECTQYAISIIKIEKKSPLNILNLPLWDFFPRDSRTSLKQPW